ncbi:unnamed protein product [Rangifer tarandus platyrhynchus]|uniref:Uncharacterized protein n=2 Tax=Rangifer tarandus platyrhynchus TaxID=3082113 RepID=A0ABN8ZZR2_RANTA|nr:unnamed protein product [Rangifer tarandus platyrhynchus]
MQGSSREGPRGLCCSCGQGSRKTGQASLTGDREGHARARYPPRRRGAGRTSARGSRSAPGTATTPGPPGSMAKPRRRGSGLLRPPKPNTSAFEAARGHPRTGPPPGPRLPPIAARGDADRRASVARPRPSGGGAARVLGEPPLCPPLPLAGPGP